MPWLQPRWDRRPPWEAPSRRREADRPRGVTPQPHRAQHGAGASNRAPFTDPAAGTLPPRRQGPSRGAPPGLTGAEPSPALPCPNGRGRHSPHAARAQRPRREAGRLPPRPACRVHVIPPHAAKMAAPRAVNVLRGGGERAAAGRGGKGREEGRRGAGSRRRPLNGAARDSPAPLLSCCSAGTLVADAGGRSYRSALSTCLGARGAKGLAPRAVGARRTQHPAGWRGDSLAGPGRWHRERAARRRARG